MKKGDLFKFIEEAVKWRVLDEPSKKIALSSTTGRDREQRCGRPKPGTHDRPAHDQQGQQVYPGETIVSVKGQPSKVMADQIMTADKKRLKGQIGSLSKTAMAAVDDVIRVQLALPR